MDFELLYLESLALTILIEVLVLIAFVRYLVGLKEIGIGQLILTGIIASFATLPYLWFVLPSYIDNQISYTIIAESFAVIVETIIISAILRTKYSISFASSFVCNMISYGIGVLVFGG